MREGASGDLRSRLDWAEQRADPLLFIAVLDLVSRKTATKDPMKKLKCRRPCSGGEWPTRATGDTGGVERAVYQTRAEN